ncbi:hypothetical protein R1flu_007457 [Riccia fluitans]|uniref:Uncharacterized protein n=1 Tax=Riccia fluitans TaxID=41844 RepID=A0ABD1YZR0_9MARC
MENCWPTTVSLLQLASTELSRFIAPGDRNSCSPRAADVPQRLEEESRSRSQIMWDPGHESAKSSKSAEAIRALLRCCGDPQQLPGCFCSQERQPAQLKWSSGISLAHSRFNHFSSLYPICTA